MSQNYAQQLNFNNTRRSDSSIKQTKNPIVVNWDSSQLIPSNKPKNTFTFSFLSKENIKASSQSDEAFVLQSKNKV